MTIGTGQALRYVGTAPVVLILIMLVMVVFSVLMELINQILIMVASFAQKMAVCPAQVFLGTVERRVTAFPRAQTTGMKFCLIVNLVSHNLAR